jgi:hypothetical protein
MYMYICLYRCMYTCKQIYISEIAIYKKKDINTTTLTTIPGVLAAVISQPADVLLSKVCVEGKNALTQCFIIDSPLSVVRAFQDLGFRTCYSGTF